MRLATTRRGLAAILLAAALGACANEVEVDPKGEGRYNLSVESDVGTRVAGPERLLGKKAEALCPDGYDRLKRRSIHPRHGVTEQIAWEIQCS
ncbi:MAG: hypothetical protein WDO24_09765 [Pseudomonadota bacterium]